MNGSQAEDRRLLDLVAAGRLDDLTPEQVEELVGMLDSDPRAAAGLADVVPPTDSRLCRPPPMPDAGQWERVWSAIESAGNDGGRAARSLWRLRYWQPLLAAAACVLAVLTLRANGNVDWSWPARLSDQVVVSELEVEENADVFVAYSEEGGSAIIWVFEENHQGA